MRPGSICIPGRRKQSTDEVLIKWIRERQQRRGRGGGYQYDQNQQRHAGTATGG
jgi:hypothetical protein